MTALAVRLDDVHCHYHVFAQANDSITGLLSRRFRARKSTEVRAVRGVTVDIVEGEVFGIIGHNGAGKTTLLRAIGGFIVPAKGEVLVAHQPQRIDVSWALNTNLSGRENVQIGLLGLGFSPSEIDELSPRVIEFADLGSFIDLPLSAYSSGMRQRLGFAIATESSPKILLMDEALAVGDRDFRKKSLQRVEELKARAGTIVLASHNLAVVRNTCNRVLWLRDGVVEALGTPDEVVDQYEASDKAQRNTLRDVKKSQIKKSEIKKSAIKEKD